MTIVLALLWPSAGQAAPQAAHAPAASASQPKATKKKVAPAKAAKKSTRSTSKSTSKSASKSTSKTTGKRGRATKAGTAAAAAGAAASTPADPPDNPTDTPPDSGIRLPLMLRTTPALPDNPAALQSRLDSLIAMQGAAGQGAQASEVRQLGPDIYAFSLHCADAAQCQRLRLAIEEERDWVAGLQLDERRKIPKTPDRHAPSAR